MSVLAHAIVLVAAVAGGAMQSALGFGAAVLIVPALAVLAPELLPVTSLFAMLPLVATMAWRGRATGDRGAALRLLGGRAPGVLVGTWLVTALDTRQLTIFVAVILLAAVASMARGWSIAITPRTLAAAGFTSGVTGTATGLGGPPLALLYRGVAGPAMRSTLAMTFLGGVCLSLTTLAVAGQVTGTQAWIGISLGFGAVVGMFVAAPLVRRMPDEVLHRGVLAWAGVGALVAVTRAVAG